MITIPVKLINGDMPHQAYHLDVGYDVKATSVNITDRYLEYSTGVYLELPDNVECVIRSRSSISKTDLILANGIGTIDPGYRGELKLRFKIALSPGLLFDIISGKFDKFNYLTAMKLYEPGDYIGQLTFHEVLKVDLKTVSTINNSERDDKGFGSSTPSVDTSLDAGTM